MDYRTNLAGREINKFRRCGKYKCNAGGAEFVTHLNYSYQDSGQK